MGKQWKQWQTFFSWAPKSLQMVIAAMKFLLLGRKAMTNLDSILKSKDITLLTKVCLIKAMVFPVVMYGCESWTIKKAECQRLDAFKLWHWKRLLRVPWTERRSNQSILKEINPKYSLERLMLKLQYFGHVVVQLLSHVQLFATPWTAARHTSLSNTNSWSLLKHMSIESVSRHKMY